MHLLTRQFNKEYVRVSDVLNIMQSVIPLGEIPNINNGVDLGAFLENAGKEFAKK